ncbi:hypothetical protein Tco_1210069 [Tanacetum coccineum]
MLFAFLHVLIDLEEDSVSYTPAEQRPRIVILMDTLATIIRISPCTSRVGVVIYVVRLLPYPGIVDCSATLFESGETLSAARRCRSPTASVPSSTHVSRSIAPTPGDLLPPRKRFRDSYSLEDSRDEHIEVDTADVEAITDVGISEGIVAHPEDGVGMGFEIAASDVRDEMRSFGGRA